MASPLSVNHAYKRGRNGQTYLDPEAAKWKITLTSEVKWAMPSGRVSLPAFVRVSGRFRDKRSALDLDNLAKLVLDAVATALGVNDRDLRFQAGDRVIETGCEPVVTVEIWTEVLE